MRGKVATMREVASHAGVSMATVSRVINGERVRPALEAKVRAAILKLEYIPNNSARSLKTHKTSTVGFVISSLSRFFTVVAEVIEDILNKHGYSLIVCHSREDPMRESERVRMLIEKQVDGILAAPSGEYAPCLKEAKEQEIPVVLVDRTVQDVETDCVLVDNVGGAYQAVEHLVTLGHRRIALINGRQAVTTGKERYRGFVRVFEDYNLPVPEDLIRFGDFSLASGYELTRDLLLLSEPPKAIFVANYDMTIGALKAIREMDIRVPGDLAVVGFDNMDATQLTSPPTTAVIQPMDQIGEKAAHLILRRMADDNVDFPQMYRLKPTLAVRGSSLSQSAPEDCRGDDQENR